MQELGFAPVTSATRTAVRNLFLSAPLRGSFVLSLMTIAVLATHPAAAQEVAVAATGSAGDAEEIVVTATRKASATFEAPAAVSVVTEADIEKKGTVRVLDALKDLPGVYVRDNAGVPSSFSGQVLMRGVAGYTRNAVLLNGQPLNNSFSNGVNWSLIDPDTIERVEVVRGPFSSLYGGAAMGGVVNLITKSPIDDQLVVKGGYGSDQLTSGYAAWSHRFGESIGLRAEVGTKASDGFVQDLVSKSPTTGSGTAVTGARASQTAQGAETYFVGDKGERKWWQNNAGLSLRFNTGERSHLELGVRYHEDATKSVDPQSYLFNADTGVAFTSGNAAVNDQQRVTLRDSDFLSGPNGEEIWRYSAAYEQQLENAVIKVDAFYSDNDYWYVTPTAGAATPASGTGKYSDIPNTRSGINASIGAAFGDSQYWIAGLAFTGDDLSKKDHTVADWHSRSSGNVSDLLYQSNGESQTYGAYVQDEIKAGDQLTLYVGARYDYWTTQGSVDQYTAPISSAEYERRHQDSVSPKISAVYKLFDDTVIRASAGTAFRSPTLSDMYSTFTSSNGSVSYASSDLKPETITAYEVGTEQRLWGGRLSATLFYNELKDMIASMTTPNPDNPAINDSVRVNVGKARIQGFEIGLRQPVLAGVEVFGNYTYTDTEVRENAAAPDTIGKHLTLIPKQTFNVGAQAEHGRAFGYLVGRYVGKVFSDSQNLDTLNGVYGSYDPFFVVDAKVGYRIADRYTLTLAGFNLLDRDYYQSNITTGPTFLAELSLRFF